MKKINIGFIAALAGATLFLSACHKDKNSPGYEYMGDLDMYRSPAYKAFESNPVFSNGLTMQNPVEGTIAHSFDREKMINYIPYAYPNTAGGRDSAIKFLKNPLAPSDLNMSEGKRLYSVFCIACHGAGGKGDGPVVKILLSRDNYGLQPPAYDSDQLKGATEGQIYHTMMFGKGNMGPYSAQLNSYERWQVVYYVQSLQGAGTAKADSSAAPADTLASK